MINNTAGYAGDQIYGGNIDDCKINNCTSADLYKNLFHVMPNQSDSAFSAVTSKICFCDANGRPNCTLHRIIYPLHEAKYPGEVINVDVATVGQFDGTVPGTVLISNRYSHTVPIVVTTGKKCTRLEIQTLFTNNLHYTVIELKLSSNLISKSKNTTYFSLSEPRKIEVPLLSCPPGFSSINGVCGCDLKLQDYNVKCEPYHLANTSSLDRLSE